MARHFPDCIEHWLRARDAISKPPSEGGALTEREKELVIVGMEIATRHKSIEHHTRKAMEAAERAVVLRLGKVIWDSPVSALSHDKLGELFMTGNHRQETSTR